MSVLVRFLLFYGTLCLYVLWEIEAISQETQKKLYQMSLKYPVLALGRKLHNKVSMREICYDTVGCFEVPRRHMPLSLTRVPESPEFLDTEFYLFKRGENPMITPEKIIYGDNQMSLRKSSFEPKKEVKILIHGYMTHWNESGAVRGVKAMLDISDCNMIVVNWERGARGPRYTTAAANTEVIGRQLGLLLMDMVAYGTDPHQIHMIGFSLGAHIAGVASHMLKQKGYMVGRITGLDPASPLFKLDSFREKTKKLDRNDALFVDVIHTDGSPSLTDGFGLWDPVGHVDFYPNGGQEQPGCNDIKSSVLVSQLDGGLNRDIACSHIRAYSLYLETLLRHVRKVRSNNKSQKDCEFISWRCPTPEDFQSGQCFPVKDKLEGRMGEQSYGKGQMYLVTRKKEPFCGTPLQAIVHVSSESKPTRGVLSINLRVGNSTTSIQIKTEFQEILDLEKVFYGLAAAEYNSFKNAPDEMVAELVYQRKIGDENLDRNRILLRLSSLVVDRIEIRTIDGQSWYYCGKTVMFSDSKYSRSEILLNKFKC